MSEIEITQTELQNSMTGWDYLAVKQAFGTPFDGGPNGGGLATDNPPLALVAMVFIHKRRQPMKDRDAYTAAMSMDTAALNDYFADEPAEVDPDDPVTDAGKDSAGLEMRPNS